MKTFKELLEKKGLTAYEVSKRTNEPHSKIYQYKNGKTLISNATLSFAINLIDNKIATLEELKAITKNEQKGMK